MADSKLNYFVASGTNAERLAFTPVPPTPSAGPDPGYLFFETDTGNAYSWDAGGAAWAGPLGGGLTAASATEQLTGTSTTKAGTPDSVAALWEQGSDVASAGTISLGEGGYFNITGTTTITDIDFATDKAGRKAWVKFAGILTLTHNASTLILPTGANITTAAGDTACFISEGTDVVRCVSYNRASGAALAGGSSSGSLIGIQIITATGAGTYTPTVGTNSIVIEMVGGGGGGSGTSVPSSGDNSRVGSGGGGAYLRKRLTANFSGASYSVGTGGAGGSAGLNAGSNGGDTTFTDTAGSPTTYTAGGGVGGATATHVPGIQLGTASDGGTATNGDINIAGGPSGIPIVLADNLLVGAPGGSSHFSGGAKAQRGSSASASAAGNNAGGYGGGGSGAVAAAGSSAVAGGDGSQGIIIIREYS